MGGWGLALWDFMCFVRARVGGCVFGKRWQEVLIIWLVNWLKHHALDRNYGAGWIVWWLMTAIDLKLHHLGF